MIIKRRLKELIRCLIENKIHLTSNKIKRENKIHLTSNKRRARLKPVLFVFVRKICNFPIFFLSLDDCKRGLAIKKNTNVSNKQVSCTSIRTSSSSNHDQVDLGELPHLPLITSRIKRSKRQWGWITATNYFYIIVAGCIFGKQIRRFFYFNSLLF